MSDDHKPRGVEDNAVEALAGGIVDLQDPNDSLLSSNPEASTDAEETLDALDPHGKHVTIYDVAKLAGVSPSTVSRTFARPGRVNVRTASKVHAAAKQLGYRAHPIMRVQPDRYTRVIAVAVADIANPTYASVVRGVQFEAAKRGYTVLLVDTRESKLGERNEVTRALQIVDGVILTSSRLSDSDIYQLTKVKPLVVVNRIVPGVPSAISDMSQGMGAVVQKLHELGHRTLTYMTGPEASWMDGARWRILSMNCEKYGIRLVRTPPQNPTVAGGSKAFQAWLERPSSAIVAYNDLMAIGAMRTAQNLGFRVPEDITITGIDNIFAAELTTPGLSTVTTGNRLLGRSACRHLINSIHSRLPTSEVKMVVPVELVPRGSHGPVNPDLKERILSVTRAALAARAQ
ncbi:MAG: LacI family DNA-binding transcriptional regulator [Actinomycetaceae bacterium]|nr:LacI family DNA-binding transcriptional regulator [Actinomycetaceae bacterium]